jgi:hypothetical protein
VRYKVLSFATVFIGLFGTITSYAGGIQTLEQVDVVGPPDDLVGVADSATQRGAVTRQQIEARPLPRPGELLETVPGLIITQPSGDGSVRAGFFTDWRRFTIMGRGTIRRVIAN